MPYLPAQPTAAPRRNAERSDLVRAASAHLGCATRAPVVPGWPQPTARQGLRKRATRNIPRPRRVGPPTGSRLGVSDAPRALHQRCNVARIRRAETGRGGSTASTPDPPQTLSPSGIAHERPRDATDPGFPEPGFESPWRCLPAPPYILTLIPSSRPASASNISAISVA
jgi:hypothetical protein